MFCIQISYFPLENLSQTFLISTEWKAAGIQSQSQVSRLIYYLNLNFNHKLPNWLVFGVNKDERQLLPLHLHLHLQLLEKWYGSWWRAVCCSLPVMTRPPWEIVRTWQVMLCTTPTSRYMRHSQHASFSRKSTINMPHFLRRQLSTCLWEVNSQHATLLGSQQSTCLTF